MLVSYITNRLVISMWVLLVDTCLLLWRPPGGWNELRTLHPDVV